MVSFLRSHHSSFFTFKSWWLIWELSWLSEDDLDAVSWVVHWLLHLWFCISFYYYNFYIYWQYLDIFPWTHCAVHFSKLWYGIFTTIFATLDKASPTTISWIDKLVSLLICEVVSFRFKMRAQRYLILKISCHDWMRKLMANVQYLS